MLAAVHPGGALVGGESPAALIVCEGQLGGAALGVPGGDADRAVIQQAVGTGVLGHGDRIRLTGGGGGDDHGLVLRCQGGDSGKTEHHAA